MGRNEDNERIVLPCKFGKMVCEVVRDDESYKELAIDLYRNDGKAVQVCVVGTRDDGYEDLASFTPEQNARIRRYHDTVHVALFDGENGDPCGEHLVEPFGDGWWGEETL